MKVVVYLVAISMSFLSACDVNKKEQEPEYRLFQEGGFGGLNLSKSLVVDHALLAKARNLKGNFLTLETLQNFKSIDKQMPDSLNYKIEVMVENTNTDVFTISESQLTDEQLEFIDLVYELAEEK